MRRELRECITKKINSQEGQNYPCSNQIVVCGFFGTLEDWKNFCDKMPIKLKMQYEIRLKNNERWLFYQLPQDDGSHIRGYRFYKVKVPSWVDEKYFNTIIYPCMALYCCDIEFY